MKQLTVGMKLEPVTIELRHSMRLIVSRNPQLYRWREGRIVVQNALQGLTNVLDHVATSLKLLQRDLGVLRKEQSIPMLVAHSAEEQSASRGPYRLKDSGGRVENVKLGLEHK